MEPSANTAKRNIRVCLICGGIFKRQGTRPAKTCSMDCAREWFSRTRSGRTFTESHRRAIAVAVTGERNANWRGEAASRRAGRARALHRFPSAPCAVCGDPVAERHHINQDTLDNRPENIQFLCRAHHQGGVHRHR